MADVLDYLFIVYRVELQGLSGFPKRARQFEECMQSCRDQAEQEGEDFDEDLARETCEQNSRWRENPWDSLIKIKGVFLDEEQARDEVQRLNKLNADNRCRYFWQGARFYPDGRKPQQTQDTD